MKKIFLILILTIPVFAIAQDPSNALISPNENVKSQIGIDPSPAHFFPVTIEKSECISDEQREQVKRQIEINKKEILKQNPDAFQRGASGGGAFIKPIRPKADFDEYGYYTLNFQVDHNLTPGNNLLDYNCGHRTYDWSTGNHRGTDYILWPYPWKNMDLGTMEIIAAADGIIVDKRDGFFDKNCNNDGNPNWNGIVLEHSDGSQSWYWHFKNGGITSKQIGQSVTAGEYLGLAGSSGSSNWPHLHFEVWDGNNNLIDPYAGPCNNMNASSWWENQANYVVPTINRLSTHNTIAHDQTCPNIEQTYEELNFNPGDLLVMKVFYRDIHQNAVTAFKIIAPSGATFSNWTWPQSWGQDYATAHAYWTYDITSAWPQGVYTLEVTFGGDVYETIFGVGTTLSTNSAKDISFSIFPNPVQDKLTIEAPVTIENITIVDLLGRKLIESNPMKSKTSLNIQSLQSGMYFIHIESNGLKSVEAFYKAAN